MCGVAAAALAGCAAPEGRRVPPERAPSIATAAAPSERERYCAWYGDARGGVLYFGESAFWSASAGPGGARGARPRADLDHPGPVRVGRFDLSRERLLPPLEVGRPGERSGVWDVLAHPNGRVYFTTFFEAAGYVDLATGRVRRLDALGPGLNEIAPGPRGGLLVSRYGAGDGTHPGAVLVLDLDGGLRDEYVLASPAGYHTAPKTVAWDPGRAEIWVTTDLIPERGDAIRHDAIVLDADGREMRRVLRPEVQFAAFGPDGTGYRAEVDGGELWLRVVPAGTDPEGSDEERRLLLDDAFPAEADFAQDIQIAPDGRVVVTRWSGWVHVVDADGVARALRLPRVDPEGLYYTAALDDGRVCATLCADVTVVCQDAPRSR